MAHAINELILVQEVEKLQSQSIKQETRVSRMEPSDDEDDETELMTHSESILKSAHSTNRSNATLG